LSPIDDRTMSISRLLWCRVTALLLPMACAAQTYFPFPDSNAEWKVVFAMGGWPIGEDVSEVHTYTIGPDSLIDGTTYHVLLGSGGYVGCLRNDAPNRKVFFVPVGGEAEVALYDFSLSVGDTAQVYGSDNVYCPGPMVLSAIDSVWVVDAYRRRFHFDHPCWPQSVVEGIGSDLGLIEYAAQQLNDLSTQLACMRQDEVTLFELSPDACSWVTSIGENEALGTNARKLFPNPCEARTTLIYRIPIAQRGQLKIFDQLGREQEQLTLTSKQGQVMLDLHDLPPGMYTVQLFADGTRVTSERLIVQR
jgi:Secretion system C-terminal sorting domain